MSRWPRHTWDPSPGSGSAVAAGFVLYAVDFAWFWIGNWNVAPDRYEDSWEWWREFAAPRLVQGLLVAVPAAVLIGWVTWCALAAVTNDRTRAAGDRQADRATTGAGDQEVGKPPPPLDPG